ncbi:MAG TPA: heavy metal translocating P-type ATPase [Pseudomonas sp.]|nr:heavy metal translocating P-type ATPase [Pseudomonas sp.]
MTRAPAWLNPLLLLITLLAVPVGLLAPQRVAFWVWSASALLSAAVLVVEIVARLLRREVGVDLIALLAILAALAVGEALVAAIIALMLAGGRLLESWTERRAERELHRLVDRAPRQAWRYQGDALEPVAVERVAPGDRLLVRLGDVVPVDGEVLAAEATLDESALTGEALPVRRRRGDTVRSGCVNAGAPFDLRATRRAEQSTYAGIVAMVEAARGSRAPFVRLADRFALALIPLTLGLAGLAWWLSGDALRALAVLVVATPCPLILAAPVAIIAGISRSARRGVLIKDGATLEALALARRFFFDKTGTLTAGEVSLAGVDSAGGHAPAQLLAWGAALAQASPHLVSRALVRAAAQQGLSLATPREVHEVPGAGLSGEVDGHRIALGSFDYVALGAVPTPGIEALRRRMSYTLAAGSFIAVDGRIEGVALFADRLRLETPHTLRALRRAGVERLEMLTGDQREAAMVIGRAAGVDAVRAELTPLQKVQAVAQGRREGHTVMVGDGINDAPALAAADVGIALAAGGGTASSEAASVVLLVDRLDRIPEILLIARRSRGIALQSVVVGMGLSLLAMLFAALGLLPPLAGALLQEGIDVLVILNALRALRGGRRISAATLDSKQIEQLREEHAALAPVLERVHGLAERLTRLPLGQAGRELRELMNELREQLLPHEQGDEDALYPRLAARLSGEDPLAALSHTHREIFRLGHQLERMSEDLADPPEADALVEIQRVLLHLDVVLGLHFAQEEELYHNLDGR